MDRRRRSFSLAAVLVAVILGLGSVPLARAATSTSLEVAVVTQLTSWSPFPNTETWTGSGLGTDGHVWSFTETVVQNHWLWDGTFSMGAGTDALSGRVHKDPSYIPFVPLTYDLERWTYTVTDGEGSYAGCSGTGSTVRQRVSPLTPSGLVVEAIAFDLTCP